MSGEEQLPHRSSLIAISGEPAMSDEMSDERRRTASSSLIAHCY
jgi:hypothetical protein